MAGKHPACDSSKSSPLVAETTTSWAGKRSRKLPGSADGPPIADGSEGGLETPACAGPRIWARAWRAQKQSSESSATAPEASSLHCALEWETALERITGRPMGLWSCRTGPARGAARSWKSLGRR